MSHDRRARGRALVYLGAQKLLGLVKLVMKRREVKPLSSLVASKMRRHSRRSIYTGGSLCEYIGHDSRYIKKVKDRTAPRFAHSEGARMRHQRPCRRPLRPERAALAFWVTPVDASSMVESMADDSHITVDGDG